MSNLVYEKLFTNSKMIIVFLLGIILSGLFLRLYHFPYDIPVSLDAGYYFWYANDLSLSRQFPEHSLSTNNAWPTLLSFFFSIFRFDNALDYMSLQRYLSVGISTLTIIPIYLLCTRFFQKKYAVLGSVLFAFEPRIIQNSALGVTEPLFIMLGTIALFFFLSKKSMYIYLSFIIAALYALVRYEGFLLIIPLSIMFLIRFRNDKKVVLKYFIVISLFVLILLPMMYIRIETTGEDGVISHVGGATKSAIFLDGQEQSQIFEIISYTLGSFSKYFIWILIPSFLFFIPYGLIRLFKNRDLDKTTLILIAVACLIPALYAYFRNISETKYLLSIIPILCVVSIFTFEKIDQRFKKPGLLIAVFIICLLGTSIIFLEDRKMDYSHDLEAYKIGLEIDKRVSIVNDFYPESGYVHNKLAAASNLESFPILYSDLEKNVKLIVTENHNTLNEFIGNEKENGLEHIIADDRENRPQFLKNVFHNENEFSFLIKIYDSKDEGYNYHLKIFKIDYEKYDLLSQKSDD